MNVIKGKKTILRPATVEDRRTIFEWGHESDIASFIYPPDGETKTLKDFCDDWKEHYFTGLSTELGRMFVILYENSPRSVRLHTTKSMQRTGLSLIYG